VKGNIIAHETSLRTRWRNQQEGNREQGEKKITQSPVLTNVTSGGEKGAFEGGQAALPDTQLVERGEEEELVRGKRRE